MIFSTTHTPWWILVASILFLLPRRALIIVIPILTLPLLLLEALGWSVWGNPGFAGQWVVLASICLLDRVPRGLRAFGLPRWLIAVLMVPTLLLGDESSSLAVLIATALAYRSWLPLLLAIPTTLIAATSVSGSERIWLYERALAMIGENPWGISTGYYRAYLMGQISPGVDRHMESALLEMVAWVGVIPLVILALAVLVSLICLKRRRLTLPPWLLISIPILLLEKLYVPYSIVVMGIGCSGLRWKLITAPVIIYVCGLVSIIVTSIFPLQISRAYQDRICGFPLTLEACLNTGQYHKALRLDPLNRTALARLAHYHNDPEAARIHDSLTRKRWVTTDEKLYASPAELIAAYREWLTPEGPPGDP